MKRCLAFLTGLTLVLSIPLKYSCAASGTEAASFLDIPVGARPAAMGSAYTALADDGYAAVWNPAGLGFSHASEVVGQHLEYLGPTHSEFLGFAQPIALPHAPTGFSHAGFGASAQYLGSGDIPGTASNGDSTGSFSSHYGAYSLAYGQTLTSQFALGLSAKFIEAALSDVSSHAFAVDVGSLYRPTDRISLAATLSNLGTTLTFLDQKDSLPLAYHLAGSYQVRSCVASVEGIYRRTGTAAARVGLEWSPIPQLAVRAGYRTDTTRELSALAGFTTGVGLKFWGQELAYAWLPLGDLGNTQYFSLVIRWGDRDRENLVSQQGQVLGDEKGTP